jgi:hypothetical protein
MSQRTSPALQPGEQGLSNIVGEMRSEQAANLGRLGREVETRLANLAAAGPDVSPEDRNLLLNAAADVVWRYFIQREVTGMKNHAHPIADYGIPAAVLARLGASPKRG